ncbi:MAG: hypothetical protein OXC55_02180 [Chloroflexi bacterium]|nr:hypothetical protein [Chloroflexota bacterium]
MDHVPTKALLDGSNTKDPPTVPACLDCNSSFARDEEYSVAFLASVIGGTTKPDQGQFPAAARILGYSRGLRQRIEQSKRTQASLWGQPKASWLPEIDRIERVVVKNARGHAFLALGHPFLETPSSTTIVPLLVMHSERRREFEEGFLGVSAWPEVGSRLMQRIALSDFGSAGWIEVQPDIYRYVVDEFGNVRMVLHEYLAIEVIWET